MVLLSASLPVVVVEVLVPDPGEWAGAVPFCAVACAARTAAGAAVGSGKAVGERGTSSVADVAVAE